MSMPNQLAPFFDSHSSNRIEPVVNRGVTVELDSMERRIVDSFTRLLEESSSYDNLVVFDQQSQSEREAKQPLLVGNAGQQDQQKLKQFDTVTQALKQFIQKHPSDELLLHEPEYIFERKKRIAINLQIEIQKINYLMPDFMSSQFDYKAHFQEIGKRCKQHFNALIRHMQIKFDFQENTKTILVHILSVYRNFLGRTRDDLVNSDPRLKNELQNRDQNLMSQNELRKLGGTFRRSNRDTTSRPDEKKVLEDKRRDLHYLDLLVMKNVIIVERINYYTQGIILPRDQDLSVIPYHQQTQDPVYDIQSCMQIQALIKSQINRLEQIEKQIVQQGSLVAFEEGDHFQKKRTIQQSGTSFYFEKNNLGIKDKFLFREALKQPEGKDRAKAEQRCKEIWNEFLVDEKFNVDKLRHLRVNLHIKVASLSDNFRKDGYNITIQLMNQPERSYMPQIEIQKRGDSYLITELPFVKDLLENDLVLLISIFKVVNVPAEGLRRRQLINSQSKEPMVLSFLQAYQVINLSSKFFDEQMKDGQQSLDSDTVKFFTYDHKYNLESDYLKILNDLRNKEFSGAIDEQLSRYCQIRLQYTFISSINKYQLSLRLDQSRIVRRRLYQEYLVKTPQKVEDYFWIDLQPKDPVALLKQEIDQLNVDMLKSNDKLNELQIYIENLTIDKSKNSMSQIYRAQVFLVYSDSTKNYANNQKFQTVFYQHGHEQVEGLRSTKYQQQQSQTLQQLKESFQTPICTFKKGQVYFRSEFFLHLPVTQRITDLGNYKLVFIVYLVKENTKSESKSADKITEKQFLTSLEENKKDKDYIFIPYYFGRLPLVNEATKKIIGGSNEKINLPLMRYDYNKYLHAQIDLPKEQSPVVHLTLNLSLFSQHYSSNERVNTLIDISQRKQDIDPQVTIELITNNDMLIYQTRIISSLLQMFNQPDETKSKKALKSLINIFERYQRPEMQPYKPLINKYADKWKSDRKSDKQLLLKMLGIIETLPGQIKELLDRPIDDNVSQELQEYEKIVTHLPQFLQLICKLFSEEFKTQYAEIRETANRKFRRYMTSNLTQYREDLVDTSLTPTYEVCSKPAIVVQQLFIQYQRIKANIEQAEKPIKEAQEQEEDEDDPNAFDKTLENISYDDFQERVSDYHTSARVSVNLSMNTDETQLNRLKQSIKQIREFQTDFCDRIKRLMLLLSQALHEEPIIKNDDEEFCNRIRLINDLQNTVNILQMKLEPLEQSARKNPKNANDPKLLELRNQLQKTQEMISENMSVVTKPFLERIRTLPIKAKQRYATITERRRKVKNTFWSTLKQNLNIVINFVDRKFVLALFDEKYLLKKVDTNLEKLIESIVPRFETVTKYFGPFYKAILDHSNANNGTNVQENLKALVSDDFDRILLDQVKKIEETLQSSDAQIKSEQLRRNLHEQIKDIFKTKVDYAQSRIKDLREAEEKDTEKQIREKVRLFSDLIASDVFIYLPSDFAQSNDYSAHMTQVETVQEILATNISHSVYNHLKQYKTQIKNVNSVKEKDTTQLELQYLFLYKIAVFEKNYHEFMNSIIQQESEMQEQLEQSFHKQAADERPQTDEDGIFLSSFSKKDTFDMHHDPELIEETKHQSEESGTDARDFTERGVVQFTIDESEQIQQQKTFASAGQQRKDDGVQIKLGLGAQKDFAKERLDLRTQFEHGVERRLCYFLNEMELTLSKFKELKDNTQHLSVPEIKQMRRDNISLFPILCLQSLSNLSTVAFRRLYSTRPGCLNRLVQQVRVVFQNQLEFADDEFYLRCKKQQVVEQFCKNVIDLLCEERSKKFIAELQDKYTYKAIVSQVWVLQMTLLVQQAHVWSGFSKKGHIFQGRDNQHQQDKERFLQKLHKHYDTQYKFWHNFKDMGDLILPEAKEDLYSGIQGKILSILKEDLDDKTIDAIDPEKLKTILKPLVSMFVQIDELTFKTKNKLSQQCFIQIERFIKDIVDQGSNNKTQGEDFTRKKFKKKQICNFLCDQYTLETDLDFKDQKFKEVQKQRLKEVIEIKKLYLSIIDNEQSDGNQPKSLLPQLISFHKLMLMLQEKRLQVSFRNNIQVKYKKMITDINEALRRAYQAEKQKEKEDESFICQKDSTQYNNQMKEVTAFMLVEDYHTYRSALEIDDLFKNLDNNHNVTNLTQFIDNAVRALVPGGQQTEEEKPPNQFYDVALSLLQDKRKLLEENYEFENVANTLTMQKELYQNYDEKFEKKAEYCKYYRIKIEAFLPKDMQCEGRQFVYRTPSGYNQEFLKHDLALLIGKEEIKYDKRCEIRPLKVFTNEIREMYGIPQHEDGLSDTPDEVVCPDKYSEYFSQNFKKQFYVEQCPSEEPAQFEEQYIITIYEVYKKFPTMTMIQEVIAIKEKTVPRVEIQLWQVKNVLKEIDALIRPKLYEQSSNRFGQNADEQQVVQDLLKKYLTNDDVGGGLPKILELYFSELKALEFSEQDDRLKRSYLELFKSLEQWLIDLGKVVEKYLSDDSNPELAKLADERLQERTKVLNARCELYQLTKLQENF